MSKNKLAKFADLNTYGHVIQLPYSTLVNEGFPLKGKWNADYFKNNHPIVLELGCGKGEYTVGLARLFPEKNFIGIDIKGSRMWSGAKDAHVNEIQNSAFVRTNIELLSHFFGVGEVAEIWITFPDPQMKKTKKKAHLDPIYSRLLRNSSAGRCHPSQNRQRFSLSVHAGNN